jgi:multidrug resistance efflux pump
MTEAEVAPPPSANGSAGDLRNRVQAIRLDSQLGAAKSSRGGAGWLGWALAGLLAVTWAGVGIRGYKPGAGGVVAVAPADQPAPPSGPAVSPTAATTADAGTIQLEVKGYVMPARQLTVSPIDVGGRVIELNVIEGKLYQEGDVLAVLDSASYKAFADEAVASVAGAKQRLVASEAKLAGLLPTSVRAVEVAQVEAQLAEAKAQRDRAADITARTKQYGAAPQEVVQARNDLLAAEARVAKLDADLVILKEGPRKEQVKAAEADVQAARAEVLAAEARLVQSRWRLDNCVIKAPITGTVLTKKAEKGNLVNPQAFAGGGGSVCEMADLAGLEIDLKVPERDIGKLAVGQPCRIKADAFPDRKYEGALDRIMPTANRADSTVNVRVKVGLPAGETPGSYLKPEMGAVVSFLPVK